MSAVFDLDGTIFAISCTISCATSLRHDFTTDCVRVSMVESHEVC